MIENSNIDEPLREAYQQSVYWILQPKIQIQLNNSQPEIETLLIDNSSFCACLITAHNPASKLLDLKENKAAEVKLMRYVHTENLSFIPAVSKDPTGKWPDETQLLLLDCSWEKGLQIAKIFGQNAFLYLELDQPTELVWVKLV